MMHVAIDARLLGYAPGGIAEYTRQLIAALARIGQPERLTVLQGRRAVPPFATGEGIAWRRLLTPPHHPWEQWLLPLELLAVPCDLLHCPDFIPPFRRRCPAVITVHDLAFLRYPELLTLESRRYYGQIARAVASADHIIAVSETTARDLVELLDVPRKWISVVPEAPGPQFRPVADAEERRRALQRYGLDRPYLLFVGTIEPRKNLGTLLKAFRCLRSETEAVLVLAGRRGWLWQPVLDEIERLNLQDRVRLLDGVRAADLPALYSGASVFVFPSLYEGFGLPPLEAMACGTPVVCSSAGSLPEVVGDAALLVPPTDAEALAAAVRQVLTDPDLQNALRQRGVERSRLFSWERTAWATLAVYQRVQSR
jgi:glycosyltransferase involved in cell wall biosynthesis